MKSLLFITFTALIFLRSPICGEVIPKDTLRVMSFNIRLGVAKDGTNSWELRKKLVVDTIHQFEPDLLGLQEVFPMQKEYLKDNLNGYNYYGRSRLVNPDEGEACSVMYKADRFKVISEKTFWLSEEQFEPGSKSWDSSLPRIANIIGLEDKNARGEKFFFINTHFDHRGKRAREESAKIIAQRVLGLENSKRVIVVGDFNSGEGSKPYKTLLSAGLLDTFRVNNPLKTDRESTLSGWDGRLSGNRIDWVLCGSKLNVLSASINRSHNEGRYPSDHYPVTSVLKYK